MSRSTLAMTHEEWLMDRRKGIGGSDVGTILGLNKWKSPYQLWLEKTGQIEINNETSEAAYFGIQLEEFVAKEFEKRSGKKVRRRNMIFEHPLHPFLRANIDRDVVGENAILECKTAHTFLAEEWAGEEVPLSYLCQIQHYMNVLNRDKAYFAVLIGGQKFVWKKIDRDQELIDMITERLVEFWEVNVMKGVEPEIDGSKATTDFLNKRYIDIEDNEMLMPDEFDSLLEDKKILNEDMKIMKEKIFKIDNKIKQKLGSNNAAVGISKYHVFSLKPIETQRLNKKKLTEKYPQIALDEDIYTTSRSLRLTTKEIN